MKEGEGSEKEEREGEEREDKERNGGLGRGYFFHSMGLEGERGGGGVRSLTMGSNFEFQYSGHFYL